MVQVIFKRSDLTHGIAAFLVTMNPVGPRHVPVSRGVVAMQVIVNEYTQTIMIVTQERICSSVAAYAQSFACGFDWQWKHSDGLQRLCVFG